jgi:hypothetical protein
MTKGGAVNVNGKKANIHDIIKREINLKQNNISGGAGGK